MEECVVERRWIPLSLGLFLGLGMLLLSEIRTPLSERPNVRFRHGNHSTIPLPVWLLSFPNSGTTYTLKFVQGATGTSTATNYGAIEQPHTNSTQSTFLIDDSYPNGPYPRFPDRPIPHYVLTKTHCEPQKYTGSQQQFAQECGTGNQLQQGQRVTTVYSNHKIAKAIHLIRNPFDNIVSRMRYKQKIWAASDDWHDQQTARLFERNANGFIRWCQYHDTLSSKKQQRQGIFNETFWSEYLEPLPCHIEFFRYFRWHHHAVRMLESADFPTLTIYYENYTSNHDATTQSILDFLHLKLVYPHGPPSFVANKTYRDYFTATQFQLVERLGRAVVDESTWNYLAHYFVV